MTFRAQPKKDKRVLCEINANRCNLTHGLLPLVSDRKILLPYPGALRRRLGGEETISSTYVMAGVKTLKTLTFRQKERGGGSPSGLSVAMEGHSQAHMDVLVACPEGEPPPCDTPRDEGCYFRS